MKPGLYLGMRPGDLDGKPYARHWNPEMAPLQEQVARAVVHGPEAAALGFGIEEADRLVEPGQLPLENGFTRLESGEILVAAQTRMPGVTGAMLEWWMGWHPQEHQRYKLWHPRAHVANGTREMHADDPAKSDREKYRTTHYVTEYVGNVLQEITITFSDPSDFFSDASTFEHNGIQATVCGTVALQRAPVVVGRLIHQIREGDAGPEMRSRFWIGRPELRGLREDHPVNRALRPAASRMLGPGAGRDLLVHCGMEMNHLAGFLPALYADYH